MVESVERASTRAAVNVHRNLTHGLSSLATISSTATIVGLLGTTVQMMTRTFYTCGAGLSTCYFPIGGRLSEALGLFAFGLLVSLLALGCYCYLGSQVKRFDLEMKSAQIDLLNMLSGEQTAFIPFTFAIPFPQNKSN